MRRLQDDGPEMKISGDNTNKHDSHGHEVAMNS
jgi:hypothetical protein